MAPPTTVRAPRFWSTPRCNDDTVCADRLPAPILSRSNAVTATPTRAQGAAPSVPTPRPTPAAARVASPTQAPTPVATRADTSAPTPTPAAARAETPAPTPTPVAAGTETPTPVPIPAAAETAAPTPTPTSAAAETAAPTATRTAAAPEAFGDGVYLVPSELAPGTYRAADTGSRCDVYRDNVHLVTSGPGRVTFEVQAEWSSISVSNCGTFESHTPDRLNIVRRRRLPGPLRTRAWNLRCCQHQQPMPHHLRQPLPRRIRPRTDRLRSPGRLVQHQR